MQDRFKFRVWSKEYKMYVEDNHYPIGGDYSLSMTPNGYVEVIGMGDYDDDGAFSWGTIDSLEDSAGDCIVEQCTGLKDKNGKLIYEGDIVDYNNDIAEVFFCEALACFGFTLQYKKYTDYAGDICRLDTYTVDCEVIGNIHENADLLENEE